MRRQDEFLAIYPSRDAYTRKFILSQVEGLALAFDSEELLEFLQRERGDKRPIIRQQALHTLVRFLPGFIRKRYCLSEQLQGVWTGYGQASSSLKRMLEQVQEEPKLRERRRLAGLFYSRPLADALLALATSSDTTFRTEARLALAQYPLRPINAKLLSNFEKDPTDYEGFLAFACSTSGEEAETRVVQLVTAHHLATPGLLLLLSQIDPNRGLAALLDLAPKTDVLGRINLALALARMKQIDHEEGVKRLVRFGEGWVTVYALRALEATADPKYFGLLRAIYEKASNPFVKNQAVRAAGGVPCGEALEFCMQALEAQHDDIRAQALESLVRLRCPPEPLSKAATPFLKSPSLRSRVNALLATAQPDDQQIPPGVMELLLSEDTVDRVEAAYALGYLQNKRTLAYLSTLITLEPSLNVRLQAIKSLSKYPARYAVPALLPVLSSNEPRAALTAARVLTRYDEEEAVLVCEQMISALAKAKRGFERALLYRALGAVAGKIGYPQAKPVMAAGLDDKESGVVRGAVEGWIAIGGAGPEEVDRRLKEIVESDDHRVAPRALMALFNRGHLDMIDLLARMLGSKESRLVGPAVETALEIGLLIGTGELAGRFPALAEKLEKTHDLPEFRQFASQDEVTIHGVSASSMSLIESREAPQEGEFDVRRAYRRPASSSQRAKKTRVSAFREADRQSPAIDPTSTQPELPVTEPAAPDKATRAVAVPVEPPSEIQQLDQLQKHLKNPQVAKVAQATNFVERLQKATYLVSDKLTEPKLWEQLRLYKTLAIPAVAVMVILGVIVGAVWSRVNPTTPPPRHPLQSFYISGTVTMSGASRKPEPLQLNEEIPVHAEITVGQRSAVRLLTKSANVITANSGAKITIERMSGAAPDLKLTLGERAFYSFDLRQAGDYEIHYGRATLRPDTAVFTIEIENGKSTVIVDGGKVMVDDKDGTTSLDTGDSKAID